MNAALFLRQLFTNYKEIGAIAPSSKYLVNKILDKSSVSSAMNIIEIGAGTGVITHQILKKSHSETRLIIIETNKFFCDQLKKIEDPRLKIYNRSATELRNILVSENIETVDCIISSLPLAMIPQIPKLEIMNAINESMHSETKYVQFQYSLESYQTLQNIFLSTKIDFVLRNFPPAFVYTSTKK